MKFKDGFPIIEAESVKEWRHWLHENHDQASSIWLVIYHKSSEIKSPSYEEALDEALCYGWVDSKPNKRDEESYFQLFSRRSLKSNWSKKNKEKINALQAFGKMHPSGERMVENAKENGTWSALDDVDNLVCPPDLQEALDHFPDASKHWESFPKSIKRGILEWIFNAKRPETRWKRIQETASKAQDNIRANQWRSF